MDISHINGLNQTASDYNIKSKKKDKISKKKSNKFTKELEKASNANLANPMLSGDEELAGLMDDIFSNGEAIVKDPTMSTLRAYRNSISLFFKFVIKYSLNFDSVEGRLNPKTFERKCYALIRVTDKKIDDIAKNVLGNQQKQFNILGAVEELNGLIVDLIS